MMIAMTDAAYAEDLAFLMNTPVQVEFILRCLDQASGDITFYGNANKTEFICFK